MGLECVLNYLSLLRKIQLFRDNRTSGRVFNDYIELNVADRQ